jgi:hypothetical protein
VEFSSDVWATVLTYLDTLEIVSLWLTGSAGMRQKLGIQGGCKALKFGGLENLPFIKTWPLWLLPQLQGLSSLSISQYQSDVLLPSLRPTVDDVIQLPKSITFLELDFVEDFRDEYLPHLPSSLTHLSLPRNRSISHKGLGIMPADLSILNLRQNLQIRDVSALPRRLSSYEGNCRTIGTSSNLWKSLPPTLTELKLEKSTFLQSSASNWKLSDLALFAPHSCLMSLSIMEVTLGDTPTVALSYPSNLTTLEMAGKVSIPKSTLSALPRGLITLKVSSDITIPIDWDDETIFALPRSLTHLECWYPPSQRFYESPPPPSLLTPCCFSFLPESLRTVRLPPLVPHESINDRIAGPLPLKFVLQEHLDENMVHIPISVTDLYAVLPLLGFQRELLFPSFARLPPALIHFPTGGRFMVPLDGRKKPAFSLFGVKPTPMPTLSWTGHPMPPRPATVSISSIPVVTPPPLELPGAEWLGYPETLTSLSLVCSPLEPLGSAFNLSPVGIPNDPWWTVSSMMPGLRNTVRILELSEFDAFTTLNVLPFRLTSLDFRTRTVIKDYCILSLPDSLTTLKIEVEDPKTNNLLTDQCIPALPHDLSTFELKSASYIRFDMYQLPKRIQTLQLPECLPFPKKSVYKPLLPFWTTSLQLNETYIDREAFQNGLPMYLTRLEVATSVWMEGDFFVPLLPSTMIYLRYSTLNLLDTDVPNLPAGLRVLIAPDASRMLSLASAHLWPPLLHTLEIPGTLFTSEAVKLLPRTLRDIKMRHAKYVDLRELVSFLRPTQRGIFGSAFWGL